MRIFSSLFSLLLLLSPCIRAAILAIDYGAEFTKLSLVKPGVPFDVILDRDSKRKIQSVVGWKREDRVFGAEGKMAATRFPDTHFPYVKPLLGATSPPPLPLYPNPPRLSSDGSLVFPHPSPPAYIDPAPSSPDEVWTPTALLAHQIAYFRGLAESLAGPKEPINQVIVTVPAWWNTYQRKAYRDALELQGLTCTAMIGEGTAVALNFAMTREFPAFDPATGEGQKEYHVIYDSGALSTTATVVAFYQTSYLPTPKSKTPINTTHVEVLGTGWQEIGGVALDLAVQEILIADFIQKTGKVNIREDKKALAKLAKEANRVKHILSANQESNVNVESLFEDIDYRSKLSRAELETAVENALNMFSSPIADALRSANLTLPQVSSLILFGGNTRVPLVQSAIKSVLGGDDKIAQNVNADEGAVLGAAFYGAALSRQFRMKNIEIHERNLRDITVEPAGGVIFPAGSLLGEKKTLSFAAKDDFTLEFAQAGQPILSVSLVDVPSSLNNFSSPEPIVNLTMRLDTRGHLATANAVLVSNLTEPEAKGTMAGAIKGLFGGKKDKEDKDKEGEAEQIEEVDLASTPKKPKPEKVAVKFRDRALGVKGMSVEEKRNTQTRLTSIAAFERAKYAREEARNYLEGYLYRLSALLNKDAENRVLHDFATSAEKSAIGKLVQESLNWLSEHAEKADEKTLKGKRADLERAEAPVVARFQEFQSRPKAIEDFQQALFAARTFLNEAQANNTLALEAAKFATPEKPVAPPKFTPEELKEVEDLMKENADWMDGLMEKQVQLEGDATKDPVILTKDLDERGKRLQMLVLRLINKKAPKAPKPVTSSSSTSSTSATGSSSSSAPSESSTTPPTHEEL